MAHEWQITINALKAEVLGSVSESVVVGTDSMGSTEKNDGPIECWR
jgi:hypothetical protein